MKQFRLLGLGLALVGAAPAADKFWQQLTAEERARAGLDQLTPGQQAALDELAGRFAREGARHQVAAAQAQAKAEAIAAVQQAREQARADAKSEARRQKVENAGLAARDDDETIRTRISGDFRGWTGHTAFPLENGQVWQQTDKESRFFPKMVNPEVELVPSKWGGWKLTVVKEGLWVKVKRIK
ncbi:MAG: hypothetical protein HYX71_03150 [Opitutae bacterium]|nr:hypothetical protein [Opitutae bacterium]